MRTNYLTTLLSPFPPLSLFLSFLSGPLLSNQYWVPRIRLQFCAEDPRIFAQRVQFAYRARHNTEALLLYHLSVDCMPVWSGTPTLHSTTLQHIKTLTISTPGLRFPL